MFNTIEGFCINSCLFKVACCKIGMNSCLFAIREINLRNSQMSSYVTCSIKTRRKKRNECCQRGYRTSMTIFRSDTEKREVVTSAL